MSGNYEATNGIFGEVYVNRKIFPMDGKVFLRKRCRFWVAPGGRQILLNRMDFAVHWQRSPIERIL
jgi:hypothetical protein